MAGVSEPWRLGRRPALDGLRGVAVLLVIAAHVQVPGFASGGIVGVTVFFTLSGFLITSLLLEEQEDAGRISLAGFYLRRARRLLPALAVVAIAALLTGLSSLRDLALVALYVGNWERADGGHLGALSHTWSLAVEEQFYLLWPLLVIAVAGRRRWLAAAAAAGVVYAVVSRVALWDDGAGLARVYFATDTRADGLLLGCLLALLATAGRLPRISSWVGLAGAVALLAACRVTAEVGQYVVLPGVVAALSVVVVAATLPGAGWLEAGWLRYVGRRSYALYLWHVPLLLSVTPRLGVDSWTWRLAMVAAAFMLAEVSWRFVERPFLRRQVAPAGEPVVTGEAAAIRGS